MIYIISGTVRSGTSMMAEMLKQGGKELMFDETIPSTDPTDDFPHNTLGLGDQKIMAQRIKYFENCAVKMMATVLITIPKEERFNIKVIWMQRKARSIVASLEHAARVKGESTKEIPSAKVTDSIQKFWLRRMKEIGFDVLPVQYEKVIKNPRKQITRIAKFCGWILDWQFSVEKAVNVVDPAKWRQR